MIAVDTNVLVRHFVEDEPEQTAHAHALIGAAADVGNGLFVSDVVLCELAWVLTRTYRVPESRLAALLGDLLAARPMEFQDVDAAHRALDAYTSGGGDFADYLIREQARAAGCEAVATFDQALLREDGFRAP